MAGHYKYFTRRFLYATIKHTQRRELTRTSFLSFGYLVIFRSEKHPYKAIKLIHGVYFLSDLQKINNHELICVKLNP